MIVINSRPFFFFFKGLWFKSYFESIPEFRHLIILMKGNGRLSNFLILLPCWRYILQLMYYFSLLLQQASFTNFRF